MPANSRMLELMFQKVSGNPEFFAWYFKSYMQFENKNLLELLEQLKIYETNFYQLSLCRVPSHAGTEFATKMRKVADFAGVNVFPLLEIVRSVDNLKAFHTNPHSVNSSMMAAREKNSPDNNPNDME